MNARRIGITGLLLFLFAAVAPPTLFACSAPQAKFEATTAGLRTVDAAIKAFVDFDAKEELRIADVAISTCKSDAGPAVAMPAPVGDAESGCVIGCDGGAPDGRAQRNACIDREVKRLRDDYDKRKAPVLAAIRAYRVALRVAEAATGDGGGAAWTGALSSSIGDLMAGLAELGVKVST